MLDISPRRTHIVLAMPLSGLTEASEIAPRVNEIVPASSRTTHLKPWQFQPGHAPVGKVGRPKGSKSFASTLNRAAHPLAKAYIKHALKGNPTLLVDSRKVFVPVAEDGIVSPTTQTVIFIGEGSFPRQLSDADRLPMPSLSDAEPRSSNGV